MANSTSKIAEFYRGKSVFITGATGFMGKVLVEKLLRSCDLDTIYLLLRPKNGVTVEKRADRLISSQVFDKIKEETSNYNDKIKIISGDITQPNLGIADDDISTISKSVSVVFHLAETVQSNQNMRTIMEENVFSLRKLLELCHMLPNLQAIVYTSTAYCSGDESIIEERIYQSKVTVEFATSCLDNSDEEKLEYFKNHLMDHPDSYIFSKCIAENLLLQERGNLPLAIVRPSILLSSLKEPIAGWTDNFSIPGTLAAGVMKGILRTQVVYQENIIDIIPVDLAVNMTLAVAWYTATKRNNRLLIYNCTTGEENPITWGEVCNSFQELAYKYPSENIFRYPSFNLRRNPVINKLATYLDHYLPAFFADGFYLLSGNKPKMLTCYKKLNNIMKSLEYYTTNQWKFISKNKYLILNEMTEIDKELFNFDVKAIQWKSFIFDYVLGIRQYLMRESSSTIQKARKNLTRHLWMYRAVNASFLIGMGYLLSTWALQIE